jgi:hypothetical protein
MKVCNYKTSMRTLHGHVLAAIVCSVTACGGDRDSDSDLDLTDSSKPHPDARVDAEGSSNGDDSSAPLAGLYVYEESVSTGGFDADLNFTPGPRRLEARFRMFQPETGHVYVGEPTTDLTAMRCSGPRKDARGNDACVSYEVSGRRVTFGFAQAQTLPLARSARGWRVGELEYVPVKPQKAGARLQGTYESMLCRDSTVGSSCSEESVTLDDAGRYEMRNHTANFFSANGVRANGDSERMEEGTYSLDGLRIRLKPSDGRAPVEHFFAQWAKAIFIRDRIYLLKTSR